MKKKFMLLVISSIIVNHAFAQKKIKVQNGEPGKLKLSQYEFSKQKSQYEMSPSDPIEEQEIKQFILTYNNSPVPGLENVKGFYLDNKLIDTIRKYDGTNNKARIQSLYLYLAKKKFVAGDPKLDGKYTLIAIPAKLVKYPATNRDTNFLMIEQSLEWHGHITDNPPLNEADINH